MNKFYIAPMDIEPEDVGRAYQLLGEQAGEADLFEHLDGKPGAVLPPFARSFAEAERALVMRERTLVISIPAPDHPKADEQIAALAKAFENMGCSIEDAAALLARLQADARQRRLEARGDLESLAKRIARRADKSMRPPTILETNRERSMKKPNPRLPWNRR